MSARRWAVLANRRPTPLVGAAGWVPSWRDGLPTGSAYARWPGRELAGSRQGPCTPQRPLVGRVCISSCCCGTPTDRCPRPAALVCAGHCGAPAHCWLQGICFRRPFYRLSSGLQPSRRARSGRPRQSSGCPRHPSYSAGRGNRLSVSALAAPRTERQPLRWVHWGLVVGAVAGAGPWPPGVGSDAIITGRARPVAICREHGERDLRYRPCTLDRIIADVSPTRSHTVPASATRGRAPARSSWAATQLVVAAATRAVAAPSAGPPPHPVG